MSISHRRHLHVFGLGAFVAFVAFVPASLVAPVPVAAATTTTLHGTVLSTDDHGLYITDPDFPKRLVRLDENTTFEPSREAALKKGTTVRIDCRLEADGQHANRVAVAKS